MIGTVDVVKNAVRLITSNITIAFSKAKEVGMI
jgi:hypothetical protein